MPIVELLLDKVARGEPLAKHERQQLAAAAVRTRCLAERLDKALAVDARRGRPAAKGAR